MFLGLVILPACFVAQANAQPRAGDAAWAVDSARGDFLPHEILEVSERVGHL